MMFYLLLKNNKYQKSCFSISSNLYIDNEELIKWD